MRFLVRVNFPRYAPNSHFFVKYYDVKGQKVGGVDSHSDFKYNVQDFNPNMQEKSNFFSRKFFIPTPISIPNFAKSSFR